MASLVSASSSFFKRRFIPLAVPVDFLSLAKNCATDGFESHTLLLVLLRVSLLYCSKLSIKYSVFTCASASVQPTPSTSS